MADDANPHPLQRLVEKLADTLYLTLKLCSHPIRTVLVQLDTPSDSQRFKESLYFLAEMIAIWFVIEIPVFLYRGVATNLLSDSSFFVFELVTYLLIATVYAIALHVVLTGFGVRSDLAHTLPAYFYTGIAIPLYAVLSLPTDFLRYQVIDRVHSMPMQAVNYAEVEAMVLQQWGTAWRIVLSGKNHRLLGQ